MGSNPARAVFFLLFAISLKNILEIRVMAHTKHPRVEITGKKYIRVAGNLVYIYIYIYIIYVYLYQIELF